MKKFKHKESNVEAMQTDKVYSLFVNETCIGMANAGMIEDNEDWQEIPEKDYKIMRHGWSPKEGYHITSVKRLSDGEVFSVGDEIRLVNNKDVSGKIESIYEEDGNIRLHIHKGGLRLISVQKVTRTPILTSEDGVELFEGDRAYPYNRVVDTYGGYREVTNNPDCIYFSTREAAETYRLNNARMLSLSDIDNGAWSVGDGVRRTLEEIVKSRL